MTTIKALEARIKELERRCPPVAISCFSNLDTFANLRWPDIAAYPPAIGEFIEGYAWDGSNTGRARLRVIAVTHCIDKHKQPYLRVELHR